MIVGHLDLDAFFAAVEELEQPELRTKPLVVGGDPQGRGVVATANYVARRFGIHSAMSCAEARRRCPQAVFVRPRHAVYREYSRAVWDTVTSVVPTVERTGLDEGYLALDEVAAGFGAARAVAEAVQVAVRGGTSLTCSIGVGTSKVVAKVASDRRKPGGLTVVPPGAEARFLAPFELRKLPGIGPRTEERLRTGGIATLGDVARLTDAELARLLPGKLGLVLRDRACGIDPRGLEPPARAISMSHEETFERDIADRVRLHDELRRMSERLSEYLTESGRVARTVTTKVRYPDFAIRSRSASLPAGIDDAARIGDLACALLDRALADRPGALRLVGVAVSNLDGFRQLSLVGDAGVPSRVKALVTGGAGFIGSHLAESLVADGWEVWALDDLSTGSIHNVASIREHEDFHLVVDSVLSHAVVSELVYKCDVVFHLAAAVGVRLIVEQPVHTMVTNVQGTETVLEYCNRFDKRVLVASSSEVYGDHREERPLREDDRRVYGPTTERRWLYADSKAIDEFLALGYHQERALDCVIARLFNTVGPRQSGQYGMVIPRFVERALAGAPLEVHGDGTQTRSFCHVADTVRALRALMDARELCGEVFNVGSTERIRILDLAERVRAMTGSRSPIASVPYAEAYGLGYQDTLHREPAIEKIGEALGWKPVLDLERILADVVDHTRRAPVLLGEQERT